MSRVLIHRVKWGLAGLAAGMLIPIVSRAAEPDQPTTEPAGMQRLPVEIQQQIDTETAAIEKEIQRRQAAHQPAAAKVLADDLQRVRDMLAGKAQPGNKNAGPEVDVVAMYAPQHWREHETIQVDPTNRPVILVLSAYDPVRWHIKLANGAKLQRVLVGAYSEPTISWADPAHAAPVEMHIVENHQADSFYAYEKDTDDYLNMQAAIKRLTGADITTFQGMHRGNGGPYIVGPRSPAWYEQIIQRQLQPLFLEATALDRARPDTAIQSTFKAVYFGDNANPAHAPVPAMMMPRALAEFNPDGPILGTFHPLSERATQIAVNPRDDKIAWAIEFQRISRIDLVKGATTEIKVKGDVPPLSWPCGITYDSKRDRVVMTSLGGVGYMYAYSPAKKQWIFVSEMNNIDLAALTYSAHDDCLYGLAANLAQNQAFPVLHVFSPAGQLLRTFKLDRAVAIAREPMSGVQLAMCGDKLALLIPAEGATRPVRRAPRGGAAPKAEPGTCIIADPTTGKVISSQPIVPHIAPAIDFDPNEADRLWRVLGSDDLAEAEQATQRLIAGGAKAVAALKPRLRASTPADSQRVSELVALLDNADRDQRERATSDLIQGGPKILPQLREALGGQVSQEATTRLELIVHDLTTKEPGDTIPIAQARRESRLVHVLREIGTANAVEGLIQLCGVGTDDGSTLAREARLALREI